MGWVVITITVIIIIIVIILTIILTITMTIESDREYITLDAYCDGAYKEL